MFVLSAYSVFHFEESAVTTALLSVENCQRAVLLGSVSDATFSTFQNNTQGGGQKALR